MYPAPFSYHRPDSLQAAIALLAKYGDEAKVMSGGQSLIPMLKLRMGEMSELIDISRLTGLSYIEKRGDTLHIGTLTTHAEIAVSDVAAIIPALQDAAAGIADRQVRSMGTIGGGLSAGDPNADWPTSLRLLNANIVITGSKGVRVVAVADFVTDAYTTSLESDEIVTEIQLPVPAENTSSAYIAFKRAAPAYPSCSAGVQLTMNGSNCESARLVLGCAGPIAVVSAEAEALLQGQEINEESLQAAAEIIVAASEPPPDARGSEAFKRAMLKTLVVEAGMRALARHRGEKIKGGHRYA